MCRPLHKHGALAPEILSSTRGEMLAKCLQRKFARAAPLFDSKPTLIVASGVYKCLIPAVLQCLRRLRFMAFYSL